MNLSEFDHIIDEKSKRFDVDTALIKAIITVESGGNPWAARYEPGWKYLFKADQYAKQLRISLHTEIALQSCSFGLMQTMGSVARELGFKEEIQKLCIPEYSIHYGTMKLRSLIDKYPEHMDVVASYNAGSPRKDVNGVYSNQTYVDLVFSQYRELIKNR